MLRGGRDGKNSASVGTLGPRVGSLRSSVLQETSLDELYVLLVLSLPAYGTEDRSKKCRMIWSYRNSKGESGTIACKFFLWKDQVPLHMYLTSEAPFHVPQIVINSFRPVVSLGLIRAIVLKHGTQVWPRVLLKRTKVPSATTLCKQIGNYMPWTTK